MIVRNISCGNKCGYVSFVSLQFQAPEIRECLNLSTYQLITYPLIFAAMSRFLIISLLALAMIASCRPPIFPPKPAGYARIDTPAEHRYQLFDHPGFPYTFEFPVYATIASDTVFRDGKTDNSFWININFPTLGGVINITYKRFSTPDQFYALIEESYKMSYKHKVVSADITEKTIHTPYSGGTFFTHGGNAASKYQFNLTDSSKNFIYGALYFDVTPNADSLKPATDFIEKDIEHLFWTLRWRSELQPLHN